MRSHVRQRLLAPIFPRPSSYVGSTCPATGVQLWRRSAGHESPRQVQERSYPADDWTNVPSHILSRLKRRLHLQPSHPIALTRKLIESHFSAPMYTHYNDLSPIVTTAQNFDSLGFPSNHPGRSRTDTYYLNAGTCLRTHTSAHQADAFRADASPGYMIGADVYRRDAIDRTHYPIFHQIEGARLWDRQQVPKGDVAAAVRADLAALPRHVLSVEDPNPTVHPERNPLQSGHSLEEVEAISAHLKRSLEGVVLDIFSQACRASIVGATAPTTPNEDEYCEPLRVRWVETFFPFTSPSWELEVRWRGDWLELLGCGVVKQDILTAAGVESKLGWAFGVGLERIAMLLYQIPDIRLFWSEDARFLDQFAEGRAPHRFVPFSKYPASPRDVAFWVDGAGSAAGGRVGATFHENDVMQIVRDIGGDLVEDVRQVDEFKHPSTGRKSLCYRVVYRSLERQLGRDEASQLHAEITRALGDGLGIEVR